MIPSIRPFPYPFRAALALASDIDGCGPEQFLAVHRALNEDLGLDVADSFWFYKADPQAPAGLAYFEAPREDARPSAEAALIRTGLEKGWIDTLHSYGDFSAVGGFRRSLAEKALAELKAIGIPVRIWTNHSARHNFQNLGRDGLGDLPRRHSANGTENPVLEYHADLLDTSGVRFMWRGDLLPVVGQGTPRGILAHYLGPDAAVPRLKGCLASLLWTRVAARGSQEWLRWQRPDLYDGDNRLIIPAILRDGRRILSFSRYGRFEKDRLDDLAALLAPAVLERLIDRGGAMVVYTHFGKSSVPGIPAPVRAVFEALARLQTDGKLWVARTSRLLAYAWHRESLRWEVSGQEIRIQGASPEDVSGLTFHVDEPERTRVLLDGKPLQTVAHPPDHTGRRSLTLR